MKFPAKKLLTLTLALCFLLTPFAMAANAAEVQPRLNNTLSVMTNMSINSSGKLSIGYNYTAFDSFTKAVITTYVEKRFLGLFWTRVDIGTTNDEWVDIVYEDYYTGSHSYQLSSSGTYRVTVQYVIYGTGGPADVIDYQGTDSY